MPDYHSGVTPLLQRLQAGIGERYRFERQLGEGGMAVVYLAHDLRHDRRVAIKVLKPELASDIGPDRFLREIRIAAGLTHPHILPVYDSGEADGLLFYVMPNMEGQSLRDRMDREGMLPLDEALRITREVADALSYAHSHGVVHRDIKPENILIHEGSALVADFGIGKAVSTAGGSITRTGMAIGTPAYMSPEQASGERDVDGRSDLYSLGCVLYEMLTGEQPFTGSTAQAVISKRFVAPVPLVRAVRDVPVPLDTIVTRSMARTPVDRFPTAGEFATAILELQREGQTPRPGALATQPARPEKSIAVLPLANMSADPENEYFSDGMTEDIINSLAKLPDVQVASRTSCFAFKGKEVDIREIGDKLGVSSVLEGSVRKIGNRIRVNAQLVNVANGYQLWSETYDRQLEDVFAIQEEISRAIVDALKVQLTGGKGEQLVKPTTENLEAYTLYLKGRFFVNRVAEHDLRKGMSLFEQALDADPGYARAYSGIADCWCNLADDWVIPDDAYPKAKSAATRAIQIEPSLGEAHTSIGKVLCWYEWDFEGASKALAKAVELNPNYAEAHFVYGSALPAVGRLPEAIEEMRKALVLDPLSAHFSRWLGRFLLYAGRYDAAIEQSHKTLEIEPSYFQAYLDIGAAKLAQGLPEEAFKAYQRGQSLGTAVRSYDAMIVRALCAMGELEEARAIMDRLERQAREQYLRAEILAMGHGALADLDRAFACLDEAFEAHSAGLIYLHLDPGYEAIRADPRFPVLVKRIGLK
ncbi:MAG: protein kinase [Gemmatimonadetes bacterium]|nr:protein kinase [Gemmatimonadota bacterium]